MPYKSAAQSRFLHAVHPKIAAKWDREYPNQKNLPERKKGAVKRLMKFNRKSKSKYR